MTLGKTTKQSGVKKSIDKTQDFHPKKEKHTFEEAGKEFRRDQASSSKARLELREYGMPLAFDYSASPREGKAVSKLMEFLCTCINLIRDKRVVQELQNLIKQYELEKIYPLLNKSVHQISKKRRKNKELHLNAQIGRYDIDYVVLDLGSEVNVMKKKT
jgi:urease gamma subunit